MFCFLKLYSIVFHVFAGYLLFLSFPEAMKKRAFIPVRVHAFARVAFLDLFEQTSYAQDIEVDVHVLLWVGFPLSYTVWRRFQRKGNVSWVFGFIV